MVRTMKKLFKKVKDLPDDWIVLLCILLPIILYYFVTSIAIPFFNEVRTRTSDPEYNEYRKCNEFLIDEADQRILRHYYPTEYPPRSERIEAKLRLDIEECFRKYEFYNWRRSAKLRSKMEQLGQLK